MMHARLVLGLWLVTSTVQHVTVNAVVEPAIQLTWRPAVVRCKHQGWQP